MLALFAVERVKSQLGDDGQDIFQLGLSVLHDRRFRPLHVNLQKVGGRKVVDIVKPFGWDFGALFQRRGATAAPQKVDGAAVQRQGRGQAALGIYIEGGRGSVADGVGVIDLQVALGQPELRLAQGEFPVQCFELGLRLHFAE